MMDKMVIAITPIYRQVTKFKAKRSGEFVVFITLRKVVLENYFRDFIVVTIFSEVDTPNMKL